MLMSQAHRQASERYFPDPPTETMNDLGVRMPDRLRAADLLNQMEGVYITKIESKQASIVELVIVTVDPALKDGTIEHGELS